LNTLLIAGTNAGVGKTVVLSALASYWQTYCASERLGLMKLIQTGGDRETYQHLLSAQDSVDETHPLYFEQALLPHLAAEHEGRTVALDALWHAVEQLTHQRDMVLLEGYGGLGSPITRETTQADLAWDWRLPTLLVVPVEPGTMAQAIANVALAKQSRVHLKGIVLNCVTPCSEADLKAWAPVRLLQNFTHQPVLGCIPYFSGLGDRAISPEEIRSKLAQMASSLDIERLLPI
jgi:dethiobiotin synthetase